MRMRHLKPAASGFIALALTMSSGIGVSTAYAEAPPAASAKVANKASNVLPSPGKEVEEVTRKLLKTFQDNQEKYKKDTNAFVTEVDRLLSPAVAFDSIARGVMGRYAHRSDPAQIKQFEAVFKDSLINFYGKALLKLDDTRVTIESVEGVPDRVLKEYKDGKVRQVPVNMTVKTSNRTLVISYSMVFDEGRWKLRNIIIDGINIGIQFRRQFSEAMDQHRKIQYVVDHWLAIMSADSEKPDQKDSK